MQLLMEIKKTSQRKLASGDNAYQLVLECEDSQVMDLGKLRPDSLVLVEIRAEGEEEEHD